MTQIEFVTELEQALRGNVDERVIQENVRYYNSYISEQKAAGKSEEEIFASLGSPRLIAKTIMLPLPDVLPRVRPALRRFHFWRKKSMSLV